MGVGVRVNGRERERELAKSRNTDLCELLLRQQILRNCRRSRRSSGVSSERVQNRFRNQFRIRFRRWSSVSGFRPSPRCLGSGSSSTSRGRTSCRRSRYRRDQLSWRQSLSQRIGSMSEIHRMTDQNGSSDEVLIRRSTRGLAAVGSSSGSSSFFFREAKPGF